MIVTAFQFQHGTIKSVHIMTRMLLGDTFQFQHGTIKSRLIGLHKYQ